jgi:3'-phosphoadenosine 5'-phosphosulfate sulfotransferase
VGPVPTRLGQHGAWEREHFRTVTLPVFWVGRRTERQREMIRKEFAARGYSRLARGALP